MFQGCPQVFTQALLCQAELNGVETGFDPGGIRQWCRQPVGQKTGTGAGNRAVNGGQKTAVAVAAKGAGKLQIAPCCRINFHCRAGSLTLRHAKPRHPAFLGQVEIVNQRPGGRDFSPGEVTESIQRPDIEAFQHPSFGPGAVKTGTGQRAQNIVAVIHDITQLFAPVKPVRYDQFTGRNARQCSRQTRRRDRFGLEVAGRHICPGQAEFTLRIGQRSQIVMAARIQQVVFCQGARRDDTHHVPGHQLVTLALACLLRGLGLFANRDLEAFADQLRQITLMTVDRHPAHRNIRTVMTAPLGQRDIQRRRCGHRVVKEQFVEITHTIEQQAIRMGLFDAEILGHHRRGGGWFRLAGAAVWAHAQDIAVCAGARNHGVAPNRQKKAANLNQVRFAAGDREPPGGVRQSWESCLRVVQAAPSFPPGARSW